MANTPLENRSLRPQMVKGAKRFALLLLACYLLQAISVRAAVSKSPEKYVDPVALYFSDEQMVEAPSRYPKPLTKVAENVTLVGAEEIEASNARTVAELLNRVAGVFVSFNGQDYGSSSSLYIHGSTGLHPHHTLVLLDGVRVNYASNGVAETNGIPLAIIKQIEIIKGPASSAWGSALGGVINIITKDTGKEAEPIGTLTGALVENSTEDIHADAAGRMKNVGYFLYGGWQDSDGLRDNRYFHNKNLYGKVHLPFGRDNELLVSGGLSSPEYKFYDYAPLDSRATAEGRDRFVTATWNGHFNNDLIFSVSAQASAKDFLQKFDVLGVGVYGAAGDLFRNFFWREESVSSFGRLVWNRASHTASLGFEYMRNKLEQTIDNGPFFQGLDYSAQDFADTAREEKWGLYINDTISLGKVTLVPGLRYDSHSITESFVSPSLGGIYQWRDDTLVRATIARGYSAPFLTQISGGGSAFGTINPDLKPEEVWSYQLGLESVAVSWLKIKSSLFRHDLDNSWNRDNTGRPVNAGRDRRLGYEIETETVPYHGFSMSANYSSIFEKVYDSGMKDNLQAANMNLAYNNPENFRVELAGHYVWWQARESVNGHYSSPTWDLHVRKNLFARRHLNLEAFLSVRNIFNGSQYWADFVINPDRSIDGGISLSF